MRTVFLLLLWSALAFGQKTQKFEDVHVWFSDNPANDGNRRDGVLNFVPDAKTLVAIINAEDLVARVIPYSAVQKVEIDPEQGHQIWITYSNADGAQRVAHFALHGGNREKILQAFKEANLEMVVRVKK